MTGGTETISRRRRYILERLGFAEQWSGVAGFAFAADVEVALRLEREGLVQCWTGEGRDHGLLLVRRRAFRRAGAPGPSAPTGGSHVA